MADTIMQDTVMQDADMQDTDMQDTTQDTTTEDTTTQDTVAPGLVRKIAKMRRSGRERHPRENLWKPTEKFHLLHLYTTHKDISRLDNGHFHYRIGAVASLMRDMTTESVKHHPGGLLHASDPWFSRTYTDALIQTMLRLWLREEDDLAFELEAELNAHYGVVPDPAAEEATVQWQRRALEKESKMAEQSVKKALKRALERKSEQQRETPEEKLAKELAKELKQRENDILKEKKFQEKKRKSREKRIQDSNEALRLAFTKVKKPVVISKTDA
ncbi:uncharacterized protein Bfra_000084 [Botrytis fragariae]|uniref:Uncharacterized protein n=1 Tax=Botrytis fragariae TaxID=1964551 RepID=A0A8H6EN26_9HELO|nr:uncharacterized protein Bfra_000084 [Botrytis fragariae]KAF5877920.1 hypothetical protein Bfra_000084 [Botrytis fragariae]